MVAHERLKGAIEPLAEFYRKRGMAVEVNPIWRADPGRIARFDVLLHLPTSIPEHLAEALLEVARECPVHHTLVDDPEIVVRPVVARRTPVRRLATV